MKTAALLIHVAAFAACFLAYVAADGGAQLSGVRRAMQTIGATVEMPVAVAGYGENAA